MNDQVRVAPYAPSVQLYEAGFTELVSVIPPRAQLSPGSKIPASKLGKIPGIRGPKGWHGYSWRDHSPCPGEVARWAKSGANIGLRGDRFPGLDIDVDEPDLAARVQRIAEEQLGRAPVRLSRDPRRLLVYRAEQPMPRRAMTMTDRQGKRHVVELLGAGRQYLVFGRHPSDAEYRWEGAPLWEQTPGDLPVVSLEGAAMFFDALADHVEKQGYRVDQGAGSTRRGPPPPQEQLKAPSDTELVELVAQIPNNLDSRDGYIRFLAAVKAACDDPAGEVWDAVLDWADRWDGVNERETVETDWNSLKPPYTIGWEWLREFAEQAGVYCIAQEEFEADPNLVPSESESSAPDTGDAREFQNVVAFVKRFGEGVPSPAQLRACRGAIESLPASERPVAFAGAVTALQRHFGKEAAALLRSAGVEREDGPFEEDASGSPQVRLLTASDIHTDVDFLVEGRIPAGAVGFLVGPFSVGKTWLAVHLGFCVAFGRPWLGHEVVQRPVLFMLAEGGRAFPNRLLGSLVKAGILPRSSSKEALFEKIADHILINKYPATLDDPNFEEGLRRTIELHGVGLLVIDTMGKTLGADQPENDNDVANAVTGMFSRLAAQTGCTFLLTHHTGLAAAGRGRGASAWEQGLDFELMIRGTKEAFDRGDPLSLEWRKLRDAPLPAPLHFRLRPVSDIELLVTPADRPRQVSSAVVEEVTSHGNQPTTKASVFGFVTQNPGCTKSEIRDAISRRNETIDQAISELLDSQAMVNQGSGNRHLYHAQPGWQLTETGKVEHAGDGFSTLPNADNTA